MNVEKVIDFIKFHSHFVKDEMKTIAQEYHLKDPAMPYAQESIRVITKYDFSGNKPQDIKMMIKLLSPVEKKFVDKEDRIELSTLDKLIWEVFDDVTMTSYDYKEIVSNCPEHLENLPVGVETYMVVPEGINKEQVIKWLNKEV